MSKAQGYLRNVKVTPGLLRRGFNVWPPFLAAGIRVERIAPDYRAIDVALKLGLLNRNYFGTHFGGSLYAMADPFFALMMMHCLGPGYVVWDKAGVIRYRKPGRGTVHAHFRLTKKAVDDARRATRDGARYEPVFQVGIVDAAGEVVAEVEKTLYIRREAAHPHAARTARQARAVGSGHARATRTAATRSPAAEA
jgi:acyl-coenzyme A thioesterase PaaI-like protein